MIQSMRFMMNRMQYKEGMSGALDSGHTFFVLHALV